MRGNGLIFIVSDATRLLNVLSKITLTPVHLTAAQAADHQAAIHAAQVAHNSLSSPTLSPIPSQMSFPPPSPGLTTFSTNVHDSTPNPASLHLVSTSSEYNLKIQALQTLVMILRSLVTWSQQGIAATIDSTATQEEHVDQTPAEESPRALTPNPGAGSRSTSQSEITNRSHLIDDPEQFEALKYRKTALQDAIQKFNFKPKKVVTSSRLADFRVSRRLSEADLLKPRIQQRSQNSYCLRRVSTKQ
jgi:brefeldin A-inhibited guanine nucleotide-exchange protein